MITFANYLDQFISLTKNTIEGALQKSLEAVAKGVAETVATQVVEAKGGTIGEYSVRIYEAGTTLGKVGKLFEESKKPVTVAKGTKAATALQLAALEVGVWILHEEMRYINKHTEEAIRKISDLPRPTGVRLYLYAIWIDAKSQATNVRDTGWRFYYEFYDEKNKVHEIGKHYDAMVSSQLTFAGTEETIAEGKPEETVKAWQANDIQKNLSLHVPEKRADEAKGYQYVFGAIQSASYSNLKLKSEIRGKIVTVDAEFDVDIVFRLTTSKEPWRRTFWLEKRDSKWLITKIEAP